jgi:hypothetical protein
MTQILQQLDLSEKLRKYPIYGHKISWDGTNTSYLNYGICEFIIDNEDMDNICNFTKKFKLDINRIYPYYKENNKEINILEHLFKFKKESTYYYFKNNDSCDLRRFNVVCYPKIYCEIMNNYNIIEYIEGHHSLLGQHAYKIKNCLWKIKDDCGENLLMYCEKDTICKLCPESYKIILKYEEKINKKLTWYKCGNGYIQTHNPDDGKLYYIHQIIMSCYGNGKGTKNVSVDHIDQNPLNNTLKNLRIATRKDQEQNTKGIKPGTKRERKSSAKDLPEEITQDMMKKYVVYYKDPYNKEKNKFREFFKVEKHPKLNKSWATTKSNKISIKEKLTQANKVVDDLEIDIYPNKDAPILPKYVSLVIARGKPHLVFERRVEDKRLNVKMVLPEEYDLQDQIEILNKKVVEKYGEENNIKNKTI